MLTLHMSRSRLKPVLHNRTTPIPHVGASFSRDAYITHEPFPAKAGPTLPTFEWSFLVAKSPDLKRKKPIALAMGFIDSLKEKLGAWK